MTDHTLRLSVHPEVGAFVDLVRLYLGDLDEDALDELTGGLEADMGDLVAERGPGALPDPEGYADELRAAAGLPERHRHLLRRPRGSRRGLVPTLTGWLDRARARWSRLVALERVRPVWEGVAALHPVWWVLRGWVAVQFVDIAFFGWPHAWWPQLRGDVGGGVAWLAATVVSVQVGRGRWWPGGAAADSPGRLVLLAVNLGALAVTPAVVSQVRDATYWAGYDLGVAEVGWGTDRGVVNDGNPVCNLQPYDADGNPLEGVQLIDQDGRPLDVNCRRDAWGPAMSPWMLGDVERWNVFPQAPKRTGEFPVSTQTSIPPVESPVAADPEDSEKSGSR